MLPSDDKSSWLPVSFSYFERSSSGTRMNGGEVGTSDDCSRDSPSEKLDGACSGEYSYVGDNLLSFCMCWNALFVTEAEIDNGLW